MTESAPGTHILWHWPVFGEVHADTVIVTWVAMIAGMVFFGRLGASYRQHRVTKLQTTLEATVNWLSDLAISTLGRSGERAVPFFLCLFFFIFLLNQIGMIPFRELGWSYGGSPTADINTTAALALMVFVLIQIAAIRRHGLKFYAHYFTPFWWLFLINIIEDLARPVTLALRLFGNIFAGEILLFIIASVIVQQVSVGPVNVSLGVAIVGPIVVLLFNLFVGTLQAFVFTLLTIVYTSSAFAEEH
ncbi:MAG TPA: F0F1 ATP synthase subunit A [Candidatus Binatia bacterium]|nr:F0F1 ATP synthase subunit A [Candidatus Binatia bacterium]